MSLPRSSPGTGRRPCAAKAPSASGPSVSCTSCCSEPRGSSSAGGVRPCPWAYKFALLEAGVKLRRRAWQGREVVLDEDAWPAVADTSSSAHEQLEQAETLEQIRAAMTKLTPHQRQVFTALALNEVPIDVLAERVDTTRGALYKTLHDARRKLRAELEMQ